jgi:hypothetical protein
VTLFQVAGMQYKEKNVIIDYDKEKIVTPYVKKETIESLLFTKFRQWNKHIRTPLECYIKPIQGLESEDSTKELNSNLNEWVDVANLISSCVFGGANVEFFSPIQLLVTYQGAVKALCESSKVRKIRIESWLYDIKTPLSRYWKPGLSKFSIDIGNEDLLYHKKHGTDEEGLYKIASLLEKKYGPNPLLIHRNSVSDGTPLA